MEFSSPFHADGLISGHVCLVLFSSGRLGTSISSSCFISLIVNCNKNPLQGPSELSAQRGKREVVERWGEGREEG